MKIPRRSAQWLPVLLVGLYAALAASYFVLRYAGRWSGSDTANLTIATAAVANQGTLVPTRDIYGLGFAYQAVSTFITAVTGLSLSQLQLWVYPIVAAGLSWIAFVMYRALSGDAATGALAALFLFLQPDFLFVIFRGSHEKVTWLATMLAVFLLARSFRAARQLSRFAVYVGLFYLATLAIIASNAFFGSSFIAAVVLSLVAGFALLRLSKQWGAGNMAKPTVTRLLYVVASVIVIWFLHNFYLYRPALRTLLDIERAVDKAAAVTLGHEPKFDPYATVGWGWVTQEAFLGLTLPSFIAGGTSFVLWVMAGKRLVRGGSLLKDAPQFLLWLLYGGFGAQLAMGIILDQAAAIGGNLQQRFFPVVMLMAFPLVAEAIMRLWRRQAARPTGKWLALALFALILWASGASLLKMTNDPWLSNYWRFWTAPEDRAVQWVERHIRYRSVWLGLDGIRVSSHAVAEGFGRKTANEPDAWTVDAETRDILLSRVDEGASVRRLVPLPDVRGEHRVYDNGTVAHVHLRPRTPYQR